MMVTDRYKTQLGCDKLMRWFKHEGLNGWYERWSGQQPADPARVAHRIEDIRTAMLDMLGDAGALQYLQVSRRIRGSAGIHVKNRRNDPNPMISLELW